jgi:hypothetical protein
MSDTNASGQTFSTRAAAGLVLVGSIARLIPHPANFTPVGGTSLFAGSRIGGWRAYAVPVVLMAVTDAILAALYGYPLFSKGSAVVYGSFLINVWIGRRLLERPTASRIGLASLLCSLQFFALTNFSVWLFGTMYPHTASGLAMCFVAALPFLGRTMAGDLACSGLLFGVDAWLRRTAQGSKPSELKSNAAAHAA